MTDKFEVVYESSKKQAEAVFARDGVCDFVVIVSADGVVTVVGLLFKDREEKAAAYAALKGQFPSADWLICVSEAWVSVVTATEDVKVMPADDPKRKEVVMVQGSHRDGRRVAVTYPIERDGEIATLGAVDELPAVMESELALVMFGHDCLVFAVPYRSDGRLGHGWECGRCGKFLQAG